MPKIRYTQQDIAKKFEAHMGEQYKLTDMVTPFVEWCASSWDCSTPRIRNIIAGREAPNKYMLNDMGFKKVKPEAYFIKVK